MDEQTCSLNIGPISLTSARGVEFEFKGLVINNLSTDEAAEMSKEIGDVLSAWTKFNPITGDPQPEA